MYLNVPTLRSVVVIFSIIMCWIQWIKKAFVWILEMAIHHNNFIVLNKHFQSSSGELQTTARTAQCTKHVQKWCLVFPPSGWCEMHLSVYDLMGLHLNTHSSENLCVHKVPGAAPKTCQKHLLVNQKFWLTSLSHSDKPVWALCFLFLFPIYFSHNKSQHKNSFFNRVFWGSCWNRPEIFGLYFWKYLFLVAVIFSTSPLATPLSNSLIVCAMHSEQVPSWLSLLP